MLMVKKMIVVTPRDVFKHTGGLETIVKYLKQGNNKNLFLQIYSLKTLLYVILKNKKNERILFFNIYNKNYVLYFFFLKLFYPQASFEIMPLWHDPILQSGVNNSKRERFKKFLRVCWDKYINSWFINKFDKVYYYSDYEAYRLPSEKSEVVAGPLWRSKYKIIKTKKKYDYVFVGRLSRNKGVELFLELAKQLPQHEFLIITPDLKELSETDNVHVLRQLEDEQMLQKISESRVLICPSYYESYSIVCQDAIMLELGIVVSKNVQGKQHFATYNFFQQFEKMSVEAIIEAINYLELIMKNEEADSSEFMVETSKFLPKFGLNHV